MIVRNIFGTRRGLGHVNLRHCNYLEKCFVVGLRRSCLSTTGRDDKTEIRMSYVDKWFESIVKSEEFYEYHANDTPTRRYFYNVDLQGRLFLEETIPKNIATSIKDNRFLDFFFRRVRPIKHEDLPEEQSLNMENRSLNLGQTKGEFSINPDEYPFVSPCGKELNFIRPATTPIVFHSLLLSNHDDDVEIHNSVRKQTRRESSYLIYGGSIRVKFDPSGLAISKETGRLYHRFPPSPQRSMKSSNEVFINDAIASSEYALIRSAVVVSLSDRIVTIESDNLDDEHSGMIFFNRDIGGEVIECPIPWLPQDAEPGLWSMPYDANAAIE